jgi:hypothetical protein
MIKRTYKLGDVVRLTSSGGFYNTYDYAHKYFNVKNIRPYERTTELIVPLDYKKQNWVIIGKAIHCYADYDNVVESDYVYCLENVKGERLVTSSTYFVIRENVETKFTLNLKNKNNNYIINQLPRNF